MTDTATRTLLELLTRTPLNKREGQVVGAVALLTIGHGQTKRELSSQQLAEATGIDARHVRKSLAALESRGLVRREGGSAGRAAVLSLILPNTEPPEPPEPAPTQAQEPNPEPSTHNGTTGGNREARAPSKTRARDLNPRLLEAAEGHARALRMRVEQLSAEEVRSDLERWADGELPADVIDDLVDVWRRCPHRGSVAHRPQRKSVEIVSL
jgi:phage replication O-like protein O